MEPSILHLTERHEKRLCEVSPPVPVPDTLVLDPLITHIHENKIPGTSGPLFEVSHNGHIS